MCAIKTPLIRRGLLRLQYVATDPTLLDPNVPSPFSHVMFVAKQAFARK